MTSEQGQVETSGTGAEYAGQSAVVTRVETFNSYETDSSYVITPDRIEPQERRTVDAYYGLEQINPDESES